MKHFTPAATAALASFWPSTNTLNRHILQAKNLCLTACFLLAALTAQAVDRDWNGSVSTNWNVAANWTPAGIPAAGDVLEIYSSPANKPVIFSGTMAKATRITVYSGASLTINSGGELELASPLANTALGITGTVTNNGTLKIKSGLHGIDQGNNAAFINNGTILLGEASSSPYAFTEEGIRLSATGSASFTNNSTGIITIRRPGNNGILLFDGSVSFTNHGQITIQEAGLNPDTEGTADGIDTRRGTFVNETSGVITISKIKASGLNCRSSGSMANKGSITISEVGLTAEETIRDGLNNTATFTNTATGILKVDKAGNNGILNQGTIHNYGQMLLGTLFANSINNVALGNLAGFYNYNGASVQIKNAKTGILTGGLGGVLTNYAGATISIGQVTEDGINQFGLGGTDNWGTLNIGSTGSIGRYAINNACQFLNQFSATLTISNTTSNAILNTSQSGVDGELKNAGKITIDNSANVGGAAILNNANCTVQNLGCTALINITSNNTISNSGTFTNEGNIIENGSGNSSITNNSGTIQNLNGGNFSVTGSSTGVNSTATGAIWTGCANTNWANTSNWNGLAIPLASQDVTIPDLSNDPTIFGGTAAVAKSVTIENNAILTLNASSNLTVSGATSTGLHNKGTVNNAGILSISNTGGAGLHNDGGPFNNNSGGELRINSTTNDAIYLSRASLNNFAKINVGNTGSIGIGGIVLNGGSLDNKANGEINIDRTTSDGIFIFSHSMTNAGKITIGGTAGTTIGGAGILNGAIVTNSLGGEITIDRAASGIYNSFAGFSNYASLKIGSVAAITGVGISNQNGNFNNFSTGEITIDRTGQSGIYNYYNANNRALSNSGKIFIGKTAAIAGNGIENYGTVNNNAGGEITVDRTTNSGIAVFDDNDGNTAPALFSNAGKLTIGGTATLGDNGIQNRVTFNNNAGGQIWIDRSTSDGLFNAVGTFNNSGKLDIGATSAPSGDGMENAATFNNQACGEINLFDNLKNDGTFTNTGLLRMNTALAHTNSGTFTNDGIIEYPQGSLIPSVTNNDVIVKAVTGECPVANALQIGGSNSFTVGTTWYKNANLTNAAGTYDQTANAFTATNLPEGSTNTLYFTVSDGANSCTRTVSIRLTYDDVTPPTIACPANKTLNTNDDGGADCAVTLTYTTPQFSDNCDGTGPSAHVSGPTSGTSLNVNGSPYTVTHTYADMGGNTVASNCSFTVAVVDNTQPTFTCPTPPLTLYTTGAANCLVSIPNLVDMVTDEADNCALRTTNPVTQSVPAGSLSASHGQTIPVTVTVTDNASLANSTSCTITFTVSDDDAPSVTCPANIVRSTDADECTAVITYGVTASDNCTYILSRTVGPASGSIFPKGTTTVEWKATDAANNMSNCVFTVTVNDTQLPTITCPANIVRSTDAGQCSAVVNYTNPTYSDNCSGAGLDHISGGTSGSAFLKGLTTVIWQATDASNNTKRCTFTVTVNDTQLPNISCPANQTVGTVTGQCYGTTTYTVGYSDNCPEGGAVIQSGIPSGGIFPKGQTTVVWRATDAAGLTRTCSFRVTVNDTEAPVITCPASQSANTAPNLCTANVTYATPTATDNCPGAVTVVRVGGPASGGSFPQGSTNVTWRAIDGAGRSSTCSFSVTVTDAQAPVVTCPGNIAVTGGGSPCTAVATYATPTATDNCGVQSVFLLSGQPSGSSFPAGATVNTWRAVDANGLSSTCSFTVTVGCGAASEQGGVSREQLAPSAGSETSGAELQTLNFNLWLNPAVSEVQISVENLGDVAGDLTVLDAQGRLMWQQRVESSVVSRQSSAVSLTDFPAGVYFVTLRAEGHAVTKRLVVQRL